MYALSSALLLLLSALCTCFYVYVCVCYSLGSSPQVSCHSKPLSCRFSIGLQTEMEAGKEYTVMGRMTFVDLAGSERLKTTQSTGKVDLLDCVLDITYSLSALWLDVA
jgi:hypothetical protein